MTHLHHFVAAIITFDVCAENISLCLELQNNALTELIAGAFSVQVYRHMGLLLAQIKLTLQ